MVAILPARTPLILPPAVSVSSVFSTDIWAGNSANGRTISTGTNLSQGLVHLKNRDFQINNILADPRRGMGYYLYPDNEEQQFYMGPSARNVPSMYNGAYSVGNTLAANRSGYNYVGWSFAESQRFLKTLTWTGNDVDGRVLTHDLGVPPGMMWVKAYNVSESWQCYHRGMDQGTGKFAESFQLDLGTPGDFQAFYRDKDLNATTFKVSNHPGVNQSGRNYIAYVWAHDPYPDGIIQCGMYTGNGSPSGPEIYLSWESQYIFIQRLDANGYSYVFDSVRGWDSTADARLSPEGNLVEDTGDFITSVPNGFSLDTNDNSLNALGGKYGYMTIKAA
ncbi:hypothetical protein [Roseibium alexandrii]|uniref:DUF7483 domain-containing protein n=1 Tax=Roseibium alexandrii TaxID=388408 RepID=UPI0037535DA8